MLNRFKKTYKIILNAIFRSSIKKSYAIFLFLYLIGNSVAAKVLSPNETYSNVSSFCDNPVITLQPVSNSVCEGGNITFSITATGATSYKWQRDTGTGFIDLTDGGAFAGTATTTLSISGATALMNGNKFRAVATAATCTTNSGQAVLTVNSAPQITQNPFSYNTCEGSAALFYIASTRTIAYQWQVSTDAGANWNNVANGAGPNGGVYSGANTAVMIINNATTAMNGYRYRCVASGVCTPSATSAAALFTVSANVTYYEDWDGDGYGNPNVTSQSCTGSPWGFVSNADDCDDSNPNIYPGATGTGNDCNPPGKITNVTTSNSNGFYGVGSEITIQVVFDRVVTVTGVPQLLLETGTVDRYATYHSGSGSNMLVFKYTVLSSDQSLRLDYHSTTALSLNGGSIKNALAGNVILLLPSPGAPGSLGANSSIAIGAMLPVGLISFEAKSNNQGTVALTWTTSNELDNDGFEILRSADGIHFELLAKETGNGNSTIERRYQIVDKKPLNGVNYYRLMQYDSNGKSTILGDRVLNLSLTKENSIVVYPNPSSAVVHISFEAGRYTKATILDLNGKVLEVKKVGANQSNVGFDLKNLANGVYLVRLNGINGSITKQVVKK